MMLFIENEYLADVDVEMERKAKVFEDIESTEGEFSYAFTLEDTAEIRRRLGIESIDANKLIYRKVGSELRNESGTLYAGYTLVEVINQGIQCSFFSGNSDWFEILSGNIRELADSKTNQYTGSAISDSASRTSGVYFPVINPGTLDNRKSFIVDVFDYHPFMYVKSAIDMALARNSLKLTGDLIQEWRYQRLIMGTGYSQQDEINKSTSKIGKDVQGPINDASGIVQLTFSGDDTPYFNSPNNNFSTHRYTADRNMNVKVVITISGSCPQGPVPCPIALVLNGSALTTIEDGISFSFGVIGGTSPPPVKLEYEMYLGAGDYLEAWVDVLPNPIGAQVTIEDGFFEVTPQFIFEFKQSEILPPWTGSQLLINVFKMFNCIVTYDQFSRTITANLFERIKEKPPIDISDFVESIEYDFVDFISRYGKRTVLKYDKTEAEYDASHVIEVENDFIQPEADAVSVQLTVPSFTYNEAYDGNLVNIDLASITELLPFAISSVTDDSGQAVVNVVSGAAFRAGGYLRIENAEQYNGDWFIISITANAIYCSGMGFTENVDTSLNPTARPITFSKVENANVYFLLAVPGVQVQDFGRPGNTFARGYAYFNLIRTGKAVDENKYSLSFGDVNLPGDFQRKLKDYFRLFSSILQDPVKPICKANLPYKTFLELDSQRPVLLRTKDTSNLYYVNRTTGYKTSSQQCDVELIKL